jgi:uncharacterized membrane protein
MNYLVIILRLIHIVAGVFWVGSALMNHFFLSPTVAATAEAGQKFMAHLVTKAHLSTRIAISAIVTVLAGSWLYAIDSQDLTSAWSNSGPGLGFGIGGTFAIIGLVFGLLVGINSSTLGNLGAEIKGKPTTEQLTKIQKAQKQLSYAGPISTLALVLALICMATARYWVF